MIIIGFRSYRHKSLNILLIIALLFIGSFGICATDDMDCERITSNYMERVTDRFRTDLVTIQNSLKLEFNINNWPNEIEVYSVRSTSDSSLIGALHCESLQQPTEGLRFLISENILGDRLVSRGLLAHEFLHHFFAKRKIKMPIWLEEGIATYVQTLFDPTLSGHIVHAHMSNYPQISLMPRKEMLASWPSSMKLSFYGGSYLFVSYIIQNFGKDLIVELLSSQDVDGLTLLMQQIAAKGQTKMSFDELFLNFTLARLFNVYDYYGPEKSLFRYKLPNINFAFKLEKLSQSTDAGAQLSFSLRDELPAACKNRPCDYHYIYFSAAKEVVLSKSPIPNAKVLLLH